MNDGTDFLHAFLILFPLLVLFQKMDKKKSIWRTSEILSHIVEPERIKKKPHLTRESWAPRAWPPPSPRRRAASARRRAAAAATWPCPSARPGPPSTSSSGTLTPDFAVFTQSFASNSFPGALPPHKVSQKPPHHRGNSGRPVLLPRLVGNWARFRVNIPTTDGDDTGTGILCACVATTRWRSGGRLGGWPGPQGTCNLINSPLSWYRSFWHPALVTWVWISLSFLIDILKLEIMGSKSFWHVSGIDHGTETDLWLCWLFYRVFEQFNLFPQ